MEKILQEVDYIINCYNNIFMAEERMDAVCDNLDNDANRPEVKAAVIVCEICDIVPKERIFKAIELLEKLKDVIKNKK